MMAVKYARNLKSEFDRVVKYADKGDKIFIDNGGLMLKKALHNRLRELIRKGVLAVDENDLQGLIRPEFYDRYRTGECVWRSLIGYIKL